MQNNIYPDQMNDFQMAALAEQFNAIEPGSGVDALASAKILAGKGFEVIVQAPLAVDPLFFALPIALILTAATLMLLKIKDLRF